MPDSVSSRVAHKPEPEASSPAISFTSIAYLLGGIVAGIVLGAGTTIAIVSNSASDLSADPVAIDAATDGEEGLVVRQVDASDSSDFDVRTNVGALPVEDEATYIEYMLANTNEDEAFLRQRWQLSRRFITSGELQGESIAAFLRTPREHFVTERNAGREYEDTWLPIGWGATITDPDVVSMMTTTLDLEPGHRVLEIGTGSGYQAAILANLCNEVFTIEIIEPLFHATNELYDDLTEDYPAYTNIRRKLGDGFFGWEQHAPFDRIIVTAAIDHLPPPLIRQLAPGGIIVIPFGPPARQLIMEVTKRVDPEGNVTMERRDVYNGLGVRFIPLRDSKGRSYTTGEVVNER